MVDFDLPYSKKTAQLLRDAAAGAVPAEHPSRCSCRPGRAEKALGCLAGHGLVISLFEKWEDVKRVL